MAPEGYRRKIAAILSADVVGYSRLMESDEETTVRTLESYRKTISGLIQQHHGRVVDSPGDNLLSEFSSVVDAVQCAVEIQHVIKAKNAVVPKTRRMEFRIGINLGDVIEEENRIYGDGVNIAARIEGLADAGGICISSSAYEQIKRKLALSYEDIGENKVKNISWPVHVYRIQLETRSTDEKKSLKRPSPISKPSIAVLPFVNMSNDPEQEYFSDGITEEILNGLAINSGLIVKARTSSFAFKGQSQDIRKIGEMLNATHIVEGSVRKSGNRIRITAQLINTTDDSHIWSEKYDRELTDIFDIQDEIAESILEQLSIHLLRASEKSKPATNMEAYNSFLLGRYQLDRIQLDESLASFKRAITLDPYYSDAYGMLAYAHNQYIVSELVSAQEKLLAIRSCVDKALLLDPSQIDALITKGCIHYFVDRDYQQGINEIIRLVRNYPSNINLLLLYGWICQSIGRYDLSFKIFDKMVELDPLSPRAHFWRGIIFKNAGYLSEARDSWEKAEQLGIDEPFAFAGLALYEEDTQALRKLLERGRSQWGTWKHFYPACEAWLAYLQNDHEGVKEIQRPLWQDDSRSFMYSSPLDKASLAATEGDLEKALDFYVQALSEQNFTALRYVQTPDPIKKLFPEYRSHPKYQRMLRDVGLDDESVAKLKIPPLPF